MADEDVLKEAAKLPIDERATHSNWKVRSAAFEDIKKGVDRVFSDDDPVLSEYAALLPKACADSNAAALDKALEAMAALLGRCSEQLAARMVNTASGNIVSKCLGARPGTAAKGTECLLLFVEVECGEKVVSALLEGFGNKVPKVVVGSIDALLQAIRAFGARALPSQVVLKALPPLFESKDAKARELAKLIVVELSRWMGPELIRSCLYDKLRDAQKEELDKLIAEAPAGRPQPERLTRKEAAKQAAKQAAAAEAGGDEAGEGMHTAGVVAGAGAAAAVAEEEPVDSYEFAEPKDIIPELKKEFWEGLAAPKWSDRKAALTQLKELASYPRLVDSDFGDVNREIKKIITKDSNVAVVSEAIACTAMLAKGLRKDYRGTAASLCSVLLEKFKDKAAVTRASAEALDSMHRFCFSLGDVAEDAAAALAHQNPKVKESALTWLAECVKRETKAGVAKLQPGVLPAAAKCTEDGSPAIREAAFAFLAAAAIKAGSLSALDKATAKMDEAKKKKLEEAVQAAAAAARGGGAPAAPAAARPTLATARVGASSGTSRSSRAPSGGGSPSESPRDSAPAPRAAPAARPRAGATASARPAAPRPPAARSGGSATAASNGGGAGGALEDEGTLSGGSFTRSEAEDKLNELFGEATAAALTDALWKARLEAMDTVVAKAQEPGAGGDARTLVQALAQVPGWDEKNFQVTAKIFEAIRYAAAAPDFGRREAFAAVVGATDKMADMKLKGPATETLLAASEAVGPAFVAGCLHRRAVAHKNPKVLTETLNFVAAGIQDFGLAAFDVPALLDWAKTDLQSSVAATRTAAIAMLGAMHSFLGPALGDMLRADVKPALMTTIEEKFKECPQLAPGEFAPTRTSRAGGAAAGGGGGGGGAKARKGGAAAAAAAEEPPSMDDLLPRADISGTIAGPVAALGSANWKERKAALDEIEAAIAAAGGRIQANVGDLFPGLKGRMSDSNKNLITQALSLVAKLAKAIGRAIGREGRCVLGPAFKCLADSKQTVRAAVIEMAEAWSAVAPVEPLFEEAVEVMASPKCVGEGMQAAITWMTSCITANRGTSADGIRWAAKAAAMGAGYKTAPVREAAAALLAALASAVGPAELNSAVQSIDNKALKQAAVEAMAKAGIGAGGGGGFAAAAPAAMLTGSRPGTAASSRAGGAAAVASRAGAVATGAGSRPGTAASGASSVRSSVASRAGAGIGSSSLGRSAGAAAAAGLDDGPLLAMDTKKDERAKKAKFRGIKFEIRPDDVQQLEIDLGALASPSLRALLFAKDFKKHCQAADLLRDALPSLYDESVACLDLLLRWAVVRIAEGNTQTLLAVLAMVRALFDQLAAAGYHLTEAEAKVFLPGLVEKSGQPQDRVKSDCRDLMRRACTMYPPARVVAFMREGLDSKNNRTRVLVAEEIAATIEREGPKIYGGSGGSKAAAATGGGGSGELLPQIARLVSERDKDIRAAALKVLEVAYCIEGEGVWRLLGRLSDQQKGLVEERLKSVDKDLAKKGLAAGHLAAKFASPGATATATGAAYGLEGAGAVATGTAARMGDGPVASTSLRPLDAPLLAAPFSGPGTAAAPGALNSASLHSAFTAAAAATRASYEEFPYTVTAPAAALPAAAPAAAVPSALASRGASASAFAAAANVPTFSSAAPAAGVVGVPPAAVGGGPLQALSSFSSPALAEVELLRAMAMLRDGDVDSCIDVMKLLCFEMMDMLKGPDGSQDGADSAAMVRELLARHADMLASLMADRTQQIFSDASGAIATGRPPNSRACKYALNCLMNIFSSPGLPQGVGHATLHRLVRVLLLRLVDEHLVKVPEGEALLKALNVLMLKLLENCDRNASFSALLTLLLEAPAGVSREPELEARWADLVVKCLIKITKALPATIEAIDLSQLLFSIHGFFESLGVEEIRRRGGRDDKPLRMVKTILHELCKLKGMAIYQYTGLIPSTGGASASVTGEGGGRPIILPYIDLNIQTLQQNGVIGASGGGAAAAGAVAPSARTTATTPGPPARPAGGFASTATTPGPVPSALHTAAVAPGSPAAAYGGASGLTTASTAAQARAEAFKAQALEVFKMFRERDAGRERFDEGIQILYDYMTTHSYGLDELNTYLSDTSEKFREAITAALRKVAARSAGTPGAGLKTASDAAPPPYAAAPDMRASYDDPIERSAAAKLAASSIIAATAAAANRGDPHAAAAAPPAAGVAAGALPARSTAASAQALESLKNRMSQLQGAFQSTIAKGSAGAAAGGGSGLDSLRARMAQGQALQQQQANQQQP